MTEPVSAASSELFHRDMMTSFIRISTLVGLLWLCFIIVQPFVMLVLWGVLIAVALYPVHLALAARLGGSEGRSSMLLAGIGLTALIVPTWLSSESFIAYAQLLGHGLRDGTLTIPDANPKVEQWPVVGERLFAAWQAAAVNLREFIATYQEQFAAAGKWILSTAMGVFLGVLQFVGSIIIAGVLLTKGPASYQFSCRVAGRIAGSRGPKLVDLCINTIRSVAKGVLGVAIIQSFLAGIGFVAIGLPAPGILVAVFLVMAIVQIPAILLVAPLVGWVYSFADPVPATIFAVYGILVALSDNVLKPMLLGRGLDIPMLVILVGAIGGAVAAGVIGLFVGSVLLALGYTLIMEWTAVFAEPTAEDGSVAASDGATER